MFCIEGNIDISGKGEYKPVVIFNPLDWEVKDNIFEIVITADRGKGNLKPVVIVYLI